MILLTINKKDYSTKTSWDELNQQELLQVMNILFVKKYDAAEKLLKLLKVLTGARDSEFFKWDLTEVDDFLHHTFFLFKQDLAFTKNHVPKFKFSHTQFRGPSDGLVNLKMKEFTLTDDLYVRWFDAKEKLQLAQGDIELLNELVAILYRPAPANYDHEKNPAGDHREKFNQNISEHYAKTYVKQWPLNIKLAIATWYNGCRQAIIRSNKDVFSGEGDPARYGMVSVMLNVAETHVFGDFEKVEDQYVHLVMMQLNELVDKARRLKPEGA